MGRKNRLSELREAKGLSPEQLAEKVGDAIKGRSLHPRTIQRWESGESRIPDDALAWLTGFFGVSVVHLLGLDRDDNDNQERQSA